MLLPEGSPKPLMKIPLVLCALAVLVGMEGCRKPAPAAAPSRVAAASEVPEIYQPLFNGGRRPNGSHFESREEMEEWFSHLPYESITLERSPCYGTCPVYRVSLHRDGRAEFEAIKYMPTSGKFTSKVEVYEYGRLCYLLDQLHFMSLDPAYEADWTDDATYTITTTGKDRKKVVKEYGSVGPIELWAMQQAIDSIRQKLEWKPK